MHHHALVQVSSDSESDSDFECLVCGEHYGDRSATGIKNAHLVITGTMLGID